LLYEKSTITNNNSSHFAFCDYLPYGYCRAWLDGLTPKPMEKNTGLKDDYGTPIKDGDTIEWTYIKHGVMSKDNDGNEYFLGCVTGGEMITKEFKEIKKIEYEVRGDIAGYFLDRPCGIATTFINDKPKCRVVG